MRVSARAPKITTTHWTFANGESSQYLRLSEAMPEELIGRCKATHDNKLSSRNILTAVP